MAAVAVLATLATLTWKQTKFWRSTGSLFARVLMLDPNSRLAHESLHKLSLTGPQARAEVISIYRQALSAWPEKATARVILAVLRDVQEELRGDGSSPEGETR